MSEATAKPVEKKAEKKAVQRQVTIKNMMPSPNKRLGLLPGCLLVLADAQLADDKFMARIQHGVKTGALEMYEGE